MPNSKCYWKNPEYYRQKTREYNHENKDRVREKTKKWEISNPDKVKIIKSRYYEKNKDWVIQKNIQKHRQCKRMSVEYMGGKCNRCSIVDECPDIYCFHHKDPRLKSFRISSRGTNFELTKKELDKCELLCFNCHRKEHTKNDVTNKWHRYRRNRKVKAARLFNNECLDCKIIDDPCICDFHHLDSSKKKFNFRDFKPWEMTKAELKKCVMLCSNCHRKRHAGKSLQNFSECDLK